MTQAILNPVNPVRWSDIRRDMTPAERFFACCLSRGLPCRLGNAVPQDPAPRNTVRAEVIRFFAYGGDSDKHPVRKAIVDLQGAWVSGDLDLTHASIPYALLFGNCHFADSVQMQHAECKALYLDGSHLTRGLNACGLTTKGDVNLRDGFSAEGEVLLLGANIGGRLDCTGGKFRNPNETALSAEGVMTKGSVYMRHGFIAEGEVRFLSANVGGDFDCSGGVFINTKGDALYAGGMGTGGSVYLREGFLAVGKVGLTGARIGWDLGCVGAYFDDGFVCESAKVGNMFGWLGVFGKGTVNLARAQAGGVHIHMNSQEKFRFFLREFIYGHFFDSQNLRARIDWLGSRPEDQEFSPQPYEQAAKVLFGMGHDNDARKILLEKERLQTKDKRTPLLHKIGRRLWDEFAGYGYRLRRTAAWMAFFVLTGTSVFLNADLQGRIVPHQGAVLASETYQSAARQGERPTRSVPREFPGHPEFNQFWFSLDLFIPLFNLHQDTYWAPDASGGNFVAWFGNLRLWLGEILQGDMEPFNWRSSHWWFLTLWYWVEIVAGWILTSLFLLSVTGVLRPRQSSGEKG